MEHHASGNFQVESQYWQQAAGAGASSRTQGNLKCFIYTLTTSQLAAAMLLFNNIIVYQGVNPVFFFCIRSLFHRQLRCLGSFFEQLGLLRKGRLQQN